MCVSSGDYARWFALNRVLIGSEKDTKNAHEHYQRAMDLLQAIDRSAVADEEIQYLLTTAYSALYSIPPYMLRITNNFTKTKQSISAVCFAMTMRRSGRARL